jgi:hypothetical protein
MKHKTIDNEYRFCPRNMLRPFLISSFRYQETGQIRYFISDEKIRPYEKEYIEKLKQACENHLSLSDEELNELNRQFEEEQRKEIERMSTPLPKKERIKKQGYIYLLYSKLGYKIGKSKTKKRPSQLTGCLLPVEVMVDTCMKVDDYDAIEKELHSRYDYCVINGEWFNLSNKDYEDIVDFLYTIGIAE